MTIYEELVKRVSEGEAFHIDFEKRTMKIGKQKIIDNGKYDENRTLIDFKGMIFQTIDDLYKNYKYSLPSERSDSKRQKYFKALAVDEMTDEQLMCAERREIAQSKLEGFILCMVLMNVFTWDEFTMGRWFYQSTEDEDLVILRSWVEGRERL